MILPSEEVLQIERLDNETVAKIKDWWDYEAMHTAGTPQFEWSLLYPRLFQLRYFLCHTRAKCSKDYNKTYSRTEAVLQNKAVWREAQYLACTYSRRAALAYVKIMLTEPSNHVMPGDERATCLKCATTSHRSGKSKSGAQKWKCPNCGYSWVKDSDKINIGTKKWK